MSDDVKETNTVGFKTAKATASVASGWCGGFAGAALGNSGGATAGNNRFVIKEEESLNI